MPEFDLLIVGQGITGTCLSLEFTRRGLSCCVISDPDRTPASLSAPALINPVTGRKFVKSWLVDQLIPVALETYQEFEDLLGEKYLEPIHLLRALSGENAEKQWELRGLDRQYDRYVDGRVHHGGIDGLIPFKYGIVQCAYRVTIAGLISTWGKKLEQEGRLHLSNFDPRDVEIHHSGVRYKEIYAKAIVICDGHYLATNPLLDAGFLVPNKGDYLICRIPGLAIENPTVLKFGVFFVPLEGEIFWVGSTYEKHPASTKPGREAFEHLNSSLGNVLRTNWEVLQHKAAIRPTVMDRRPILGRHPDFSNVYFFNGMGTKGASLAPFFAKHLADHILEKLPLIPEVDLSRFYR